MGAGRLSQRYGLLLPSEQVLRDSCAQLDGSHFSVLQFGTGRLMLDEITPARPLIHITRPIYQTFAAQAENLATKEKRSQTHKGKEKLDS